MSYGIKLHIWGEYACFTRPEMKVERVSYDVITPSAARGILEAIHWKPAIRWQIDRIHVLKPIRFESIRRNEVGSKISARNVTSAMNAKSTEDLHLVSDELISIVAPGQSLFDGWSLVESLRSVFAGQGVAVHVGLSSWPMEGPTVTDVFGAAVAALVEDRSRAPEPSDEEFVEIDGIELAFQGAGEFLSA